MSMRSAFLVLGGALVCLIACILLIWAIIRTFIRMSYIGPAIALSQPTGFRQSWEQTKPSYKQLRNIVVTWGVLCVLLKTSSLVFYKAPPSLSTELSPSRFFPDLWSIAAFIILHTPLYIAITMFYQKDVLKKAAKI